MNDVVISKKGTLDVIQKILYTVPTGRIFILVDWFVINNTSSDATEMNVKVGSQPVFPGDILTAYSKYYESRRHIELIAGDTIVVSGTGNVQYFFSGIEQDASAYVSGETSPSITQEDLEAFRKQYSSLESTILGYKDTTAKALKDANESLSSANSSLSKANSAIEKANTSNATVDLAYQKIKGYRGSLTGDYTTFFSIPDTNHFEYEIGIRLMNKTWDGTNPEKNVYGKGNGYLRFLLSWNSASATLSFVPIETFGLGDYDIAVVRDVNNGVISVIANTTGISLADMDIRGANALETVEYTVPYTALTSAQFATLKSNQSMMFLIEGLSEEVDFSSTETTGTNANTLTFERIGSNIHVLGTVNFASAATDNSYMLCDAGQLKSKYCPLTSHEVLVFSHQNAGANRSIFRLCVDTNGKVTLKPAISTNFDEGNNAVTVDCSYPLN